MDIDLTNSFQDTRGTVGLPSGQNVTGSNFQKRVLSGGKGASSLEGAKEAWGPDKKRYRVLLAWISDVIANVPVERCAIVKKMKTVVDQDIFCDAELAWLAFMKLPCAINKMLERFEIVNNGRHNFADW